MFNYCVKRWVLKCSFLTEVAEGLGQGEIQGLARETFPIFENLNSI